MIPTLTKTDFERRRTQAELRDWVDNLHRSFSHTIEGKRALRLKKGHLVKKFMEEIWPLALFADAFYRGRSYDARLFEASTHPVLHHLQITQSFDGYQNHLRMLHLDEHGRAPVTGPKLKKDKTSGHVQETWPEAVCHEHLLAQTFEAIRTAVQGKSRMRYESDTSLIVEIEDHHIHSESDRRTLDDFARSTLVPVAARFATLYFVSDRERLAIKCEIHAGCASL